MESAESQAQAAMTAIQKPSTVAGLPDPEAIPTKPAKNTTPVTRE
jgi:hypothetical protein